MDVKSLTPKELEPFLERRKADFLTLATLEIDVFLKEILEKANDFVPSESGSILLDDPSARHADGREKELVFISAFGGAAHDLVGQRVPSDIGIVGHVYMTGRAYLSLDVQNDPLFFPEFDRQLGHRSDSILCVPIKIEKHVCGVLELLNRADGKSYTPQDMDLLEIFAGYISTSIQNLLDARRAREAAKRDDLTGLANDRWFHHQLLQEVMAAESNPADLTLLFFDLDNFKSVNDNYGHLAGSQVLKEIGYLLREVVTRPNTTLCRYGGDEFVVILPDCDTQEGMRIGESVRHAIRDAAFLKNKLGSWPRPLELRNVLTCSIGVASLRTHVGADGTIDRRKDDLLRKADEAMYQAKEAGKDQLCLARLRQGA